MANYDFPAIFEILHMGVGPIKTLLLISFQHKKIFPFQRLPRDDLLDFCYGGTVLRPTSEYSWRMSIGIA